MGRGATFTDADLKRNPRLAKLIEAAIQRDDGQKTTRNNPAVPSANMEPGAGNGTAEADRFEVPRPPVNLRVHTVGKRGIDADGICAKWAIDGIIRAGILPDDGPEFIQEFTQTTRRGEEEQTIITIEWKQ